MACAVSDALSKMAIEFARLVSHNRKIALVKSLMVTYEGTSEDDLDCKEALKSK